MFQLKPSKLSLQGSLRFLAATTLLTSLLPPAAPTLAQTSLQCVISEDTGITIANQASYTYINKNEPENPVILGGVSNPVNTTVSLQESTVTLESQGIKDSNGNYIIGLGTVADGLNQKLLQLGLSPDAAKAGSSAGIQAFASLSADTDTQKTIAQVKSAIASSVPQQANLTNSVTDQSITLALMGLSPVSLESMGLTPAQVESATQAATAVIANSDNTPFQQVTENAFQAVTSAVSPQAKVLTQMRDDLKAELNNSRRGVTPSIGQNNQLYYHFRIADTGRASAEVTIPDAYTLQQTGLSGPGSVTGVEYEVISTTKDTPAVKGNATQSPATLTIKPGEQLQLVVAVKVTSLSQTPVTSISLDFGNNCGGGSTTQTLSLVSIETSFTDPFGRVVGCSGELLSDYRGFSVGLYEPDPSDPTGGITGTIPLTATELPDNSDNSIPKGIKPNTQNSNPFYFTNSDQGKYSFLFDQKRGQLDKGRTYILLVKPAPDSNYDERRIRIVIGDKVGDVVKYTASSLDGKPINVSDRSKRTSLEGEIVTVEDANRIGLILAIFDLSTSVCQAREIRIDKTGDRAAAEPGDTVIYRLSIRNLSTDPLSNLVITDTLPEGFNFLPDSVRGNLNDQDVAIETNQDGRTITFRSQVTIPSTQVLTIAYAAQLTPDSLRGSGRNSAIAVGQLPNRDAKDGPVTHQLRIQPGIVADCGTIIGRVFVDKNFDGEQQRGEPGVPNAVIFMDDGNRITTDANGLFSLANVQPGYRTGALDITSTPGYAIAPNLYVSERNSKSRLVHLAPGSMVRMNFAVTPTSQPEEKQ